MGNMAIDHFLFCCLEDSTVWSVSVWEQFLLAQGFEHLSAADYGGLFPKDIKKRTHKELVASCLHN